MHRKYVIGAVFVIIFLASIVSVTAATQSIFLNPSDPNGQSGNSATQVYASNPLRMTARTTVSVNTLVLYEDGSPIADLANNGGCVFGNCWVVMDITKNRAAVHTYTASASNGVDVFINVPSSQNLQWLNNLPTSVPGGPYTGYEGSPITFDGSNSYDHAVEMAHGSIITTYEWDWENDGTFDTSSSSPTAQHTWPDDATPTVALRVTDSDGGQNIATITVTVNNVAPTASASNNGPVNEGSPATITCSQTDPGADTFTYSFDWDNDGTYEIVDQAATNAQYTWYDNGVYTVKIRVRDDDGGWDTATTQVTVNDLAPTGATISGNLGPTEGVQETYSVTPLPYPYTYPDAITGYEWDWEYDGSTFVPSSDTGTSASHIYNNNGTFTIAVRVTDDDGSTAIGTLGVTVSDITPTITNVAGTNSMNEGQYATVTVTATTLNSADLITTYDWDWDNDGTYDGTTAGATSSWQYLDNGTYTLTVRVNDEDSSVTDSSHAIVVNDLGPTASFTWTPTTPDEAQTVTFTDTSTSFPDSIVAWLWNFGDGTPTSTLQNPTHAYADNGTYSLSLTVTDDDGTQSTDSSQSINVNNVVPTDPTTLTPTTGVYGGTNNIVSISCSGSNDADTLVYDIDAFYNGGWTNIVTGDTDGNFNWDVSAITTQPGVDLRCRAMDTDNYYSNWFNPAGDLTVDNTASVVNFAAPTPADTSRQTGNQVTINVTVTDQITLVDSCTLDWNDGTTQTNITMTRSTPDNNGVYYCTSTQSTVDGSTYTYRVYANDTANNIGSSVQRTFTENSLPSSSTPTLTPASPTTTSVVTCSVNYADAESDAGIIHFTWHVNGQVLTTNTNSSVVSGSNVIDTLASSNFVKNDVLICEVWSNDGYEDEAKQNSTGLTIGNTAPVITTTPATITKNADGTQMAYDFNATDIDVTELVDTLTWSINDTRLSIDSSTGLVTDTPIESEQGTYTVLVTVSDGTAQANHAFQYVIVDVTPPTTTDNYADSGWMNSAQTITLSCSDNGVGCSTTMYCVDQADTCTPSTVYTGPVTITVNDTNYIRYHSNDTNNNWESVNSQRVRIDMVAPSISDDFAADGIWLGIANGTQTVTLTPTDNSLGSGIDTVTYCTGASCTPNTTVASPYQLIYSAQQNTIVRYMVNDTAGNPSAIGQYTVMIDLTPPAVIHNNTFDGVWTGSGYSVLHTATDTGGSGFIGTSNPVIYWCSGASCTPATAAFSPHSVSYTSNDQVQTYRFMTYDNASNPSPIVEYTVMIDVTSPNLWLVSPANASYSNTNPTNFTVYATDNYDTSMTCESYIDGSLSQTFPCLNGTTTLFQEALADGNHTWQVVLKDNATNSNTSAIWNITVDTVAPTSFTTGYTPGWVTTSPMMITLGATDPAPSSGLPPFSLFPFASSPISYCTTQNCTPNILYFGPAILFATDGIHYLGHRAVDNAGNLEVTQHKTIMIDTVAPAFSNYVTSPASPTEDQDIAINVTVTEATSGVASIALMFQGTTSYPATNVGGNVWQVVIGQGNYSARQNINYYWTANDTAGNTNNSANQAFSVVNQVPYLNPAPSLNDTAPYTTDTLFCNAGTFQDDDAGDTQQSTSFMWLKNGAQIAGQTTQTLDLSQSGFGDRGDVIICSQQVSDGFANSLWHNSTPATVHNTAPTVPTALTPATGLYGGVNNIVSISCSGSTDPDPTDAVSYDIDAYYDSNWTNIASNDADGNFNWDVSGITTQTGVDLRCSGTDGTSNSAYYNPAGTFSIDNTAPTTTDDYTQSSVWQTTPQTVTLTCTDTGAAGCDTSLYCIDQSNSCAPNTVYASPITITNNGTNYLRYTSNDTLNNQEGINADTVRIDLIAPTITDNYAFNGVWIGISQVPQTVTLNPVDNAGGSGINQVMYCTGAAPCNPATGTVLASPYQLVYSAQQNIFTNYQAWDVAGNPSAIGQYQVMMDLAVPTITDDYALDGVWTSTSPQTVTLTPADTGGSGLNQVLVCVGAGCTPNIVVPAPYITNHTGDQNLIVRYMANDVATNPSAIGQYQVMIDTTAPAITLNSPANGSSSNNNNVTLSWTATDNYATSLSCTLYINGGPAQTAPCTSGVASTFNFNAAPGQYTWYVTATDHLNLTGTSGTNGFTIDNTAPTLSGSYLEGGWIGTGSRWFQTPNYEMIRVNGIASEVVSWTGIDVEDSGSNVVYTFPNVTNNQTLTTAWWNTSGLADGQYTVKAVMTDLASNTNTAVLGSYHVDNTAPSYSNFVTPNITETHTGGVAVSMDAADSGSGVDTTTNGFLWYAYNGTMTPLNTTLAYQSGSTWAGTIPSTDWNAQRGNTMIWAAGMYDNVGNIVVSATQSELIDHVNDAPVMNVGGLNGMTLAEDTSTTVDLTTYATDEEDAQNVLVWSCTSNIGNVPVFVTNRILNITATNDFNGIVTVSCIVTDTNSATHAGNFNVNVTPVNDAPVLTNMGTQLAFVLETYSGQMNVNDVDGDTLTFTDNTNLFDIGTNTGLISFMPTLTQKGEYMVNLTATDGQYMVDENVNFTVYVRHDIAVTNIAYSKAGTDVYINDNVQVNATVSNIGYTAETFTLNLRDGTNVVSSQQVSLVPGQTQVVSFTWNPAISGYRTVSVQSATVAGEGDATNNVQYLNNIRVWSASEVIDTSKFVPQFNPNPVNQSSLFTMRFRLQNINVNKSFQNFPVTITVPSGFVLIGSSQQYYNLAPGQNSYQYFNVTSPAAAGSHTITITAGYNEYSSPGSIGVV